MRYAKITETDEKYVEEFKAFLMAQGAEATEDPTLLTVPDTIDLDAYHGVEVYDHVPKAFDQEYADVVAWLEGYTGNFDFYVSLKTQYKTKGKLSLKQVESVRKAITKDAAYKEAQAVKQTTQDYSIKPGQIIQVTKWAAAKFAQAGGYDRPHFAFEVIKVEAETPKAFRLTVKMTAQRTVFCCVCGLSLTNAASRAAGIGPICADKSGVSFGESSLAELTARLTVTVPVTEWLPKGAIKTVDGKPYEGRGY